MLKLNTRHPETTLVLFKMLYSHLLVYSYGTTRSPYGPRNNYLLNEYPFYFHDIILENIIQELKITAGSCLCYPGTVFMIYWDKLEAACMYTCSYHA